MNKIFFIFIIMFSSCRSVQKSQIVNKENFCDKLNHIKLLSNQGYDVKEYNSLIVQIEKLTKIKSDGDGSTVGILYMPSVENFKEWKKWAIENEINCD